MTGIYEHLHIEKEPLVNDRRRKTIKIPPIHRENPRLHGQKLRENLEAAARLARSQPGAEDGRIVLKLNYTGNLDLSKLNKHGVEFLSQEDKSVCVVFASEQGLAEFAEHLAKLGVAEDDELTYKNILLALEGVDNWSREDRESWALNHFGLPALSTYLLDVELWPVGFTHSPERMQETQYFERWLSSRGIRIVDRINRDSLVLYRLEVSSGQAEALLEHRDVRFVDLPPRTGISYQQIAIASDIDGANIPAPLPDAARVCVLDSGINSNHPLLKSAFGEAESFIDGQGPEDEAGHGTAVAGIVLYGNLEACLAANRWNPEVWLYSGKVMNKAADSDDAVFDAKTIEQTIEKSVNYFAGERGCRIFNLSLGNENAPYDGRHIRGIAYTLDRLAREYNVLFVVSAGNFRGTETLPKADWRAEYPEYLFADESCIIDPAPALNVLTIGSLANHTATANEQNYGNREINELSPASEDQPSPFTRHGYLKGTFKPDLMAHGGNLATPIRREGEQWKKVDRHLGVMTLNHDFLGAPPLKSISGTSFAAPYVTHLAGRLLNLYPNASANLLRALLANHASIPESCRAVFPDSLQDRIREVTGYGKIDEDTLFRSTDYEVVLLTEDAIENDAHQFYELPLPDSFLRSSRVVRNLRVTLAYCPAVRTTRVDYMATKINFRLVKGKSLQEVQRHFNQDHKKDVDTISDARATDREITSQQREKGTLQSSIWKFKQLNPAEKWFVVVTRQDKEWGRTQCAEMESYALVVTVTDRENQEAELYVKIQDRMREQARIRARLRE
jgi:hypothetical protein